MGSRGQHSNAGFAYGYPPTHQNPGVYSTHYGTPMPPQSSYDDQQDTPLPAPPAAIASVVHATHAPAPQYPPNAYAMLPATSVSYELTPDGQLIVSSWRFCGRVDPPSDWRSSRPTHILRMPQVTPAARRPQCSARPILLPIAPPLRFYSSQSLSPWPKPSRTIKCLWDVSPHQLSLPTTDGCLVQVSP